MRASSSRASSSRTGSSPVRSSVADLLLQCRRRFRPGVGAGRCGVRANCAWCASGRGWPVSRSPRSRRDANSPALSSPACAWPDRAVSRSSRKRSTNSSWLSAKRNSSSPSPSGLPCDPPPPAGARRARDGFAFDIILVAGQHVIAHAALRRAVEARLAHAFARDRHLPAALHITDRAVAGGVAHRAFDQGFRPPEKALTIGETSLPPGLRRRSTICIRSPRFAGLPLGSTRLFHTHVPLDEPADLTLGVTALGHSVDELTVFSSRSRCPSSSRRRSPAADPRPG